jgi:hypothetical protein
MKPVTQVDEVFYPTESFGEHGVACGSAQCLVHTPVDDLPQNRTRAVDWDMEKS